MEGDPAKRGLGLEGKENSSHQGVEVSLADLQAQLAGLELGQIEELVDHSEQLPGVAHDESRGSLGGAFRSAFQQLLHWTENQSQGGAELVRDVGEEPRLHAIKLEPALSLQALELELVLEAFAIEPEAEACGEHCNGQEPVGDICPRRRPPGWKDGDSNRRASVVPDVVVVGSPDPQGEVAGGQVGEGDEPARADLVPRVVEALQTVGVAVLGGLREVEGRELEGEDVLAVGQNDPVGHRDRPFEWWSFAVAHGLVEELEVGEDDGRNVVIGGDRVRMKEIESVDPTEEHGSIRRLEVGPGVELVALQPVGSVEVAEALGSRVET